mmetsp:Transcript_18056/g.58898  ORF Transcript_18056/g.58898 Transcript_18056/m.58898 type:complete len:270 (-) Transcript_18056:30-839(-)
MKRQAQSVRQTKIVSTRITTCFRVSKSSVVGGGSPISQINGCSISQSVSSHRPLNRIWPQSCSRSGSSLLFGLPSSHPEKRIDGPSIWSDKRVTGDPSGQTHLPSAATSLAPIQVSPSMRPCTSQLRSWLVIATRLPPSMSQCLSASRHAFGSRMYSRPWKSAGAGDGGGACAARRIEPRRPRTSVCAHDRVVMGGAAGNSTRSDRRLASRRADPAPSSSRRRRGLTLAGSAPDLLYVRPARDHLPPRPSRSRRAAAAARRARRRAAPG